MALSAAYLGSPLAHPVRITPQNRPGVRVANGREITLPISYLVHETFTNASTIDADGISVSHAGPNLTTATTIGGALASGGVATLTPSRAVIMTVTHSSSIVAMSAVVTGTDMYGKAISETVAVTATGTAKTAVSLQAFKTVTGIAETAATDASGNSVLFGDSKVIGLAHKAASVRIVAEEQDGALPTAGVIVKGSTSAGADARGTYTPNATLNGALDFDVWYLVDDPTTL